MFHHQSFQWSAAGGLIIPIFIFMITFNVSTFITCFQVNSPSNPLKLKLRIDSPAKNLEKSINLHQSHSELFSSSQKLESDYGNDEEKLIHLSSSRKAATTLSSIILSVTLILGQVPQPVEQALGEKISSVACAAELTEEQRLVAQTWRLVDKLYVDRTFNGIDWFKVRQDAVKKKYKSMDEAYSTITNFLSDLGDPYTRFLAPSKYRSLVNSATGEVAGIGVELFVDSASGYVSVADVLPGSPAEAAGLKPGDLLIEVSAENTKGEVPDDTATRLRGPVGTKVGLVAQRDGKPIELILNRDKVKIQGVRSSLETSKGKKIGVIKIKSFSSNTADDVRSTLASLKQQGAEEFILDLRGNAGGLLPGGVDTAKLFLKKDSPIVYVITKTGVVDAQSATFDGPEVSVPLLVTVDGRTASAAEVVSAALKENGRAKLVGTRTFGKGVIQTIEGLYGDAGVAVTIAKYETPQRNNINKVGIPVDIEFECKTTDPTLSCVPESLL